MRSFTFSFDRAPESGGWKQLLIVAVTFVVVVASIEVGLRASGGKASAALTNDRWSANLQAALNSTNPFTTVLLGSSQVRTGFSSKAFSRRYLGTPLFYLASTGDSPFATVLYLAHNTNFSGRVIVSLQERSLETCRLEDQRYIVDFYSRDWRIDRRIDFKIEDVFETLVFRQPRFAVSSVLDSLIRDKGVPAAKTWRQNYRNGETDYHFSQADSQSLNRRRARHEGVYEVADVDDWTANFRRLNAAVERIIERGGQVALVKWPLDASWATRNAQRFPPDRFWDSVVTAGRAVAVDASRLPEFESFSQPDGNHIDADDKIEFTDILLDVLEARGMNFRPSR